MRILLTPTTESSTVELSRTMYRKKILPLGSIEYNGKKVNFDKPYLQELAKNFQAGPYDQVLAMLADKDNAHTLAVDRIGGQIREVEVTDEGLFGVFQLSEDAAKAVKNSGNGVGVSVRVTEGAKRMDGSSVKTFGRALQHVLLTTDPKVTGMGAWTEVELSGYNEDDEVVDLTLSSYEGDRTMPNGLDVTTASLDQLNQLTQEQLDALSEEELDAINTRVDAIIAEAGTGDAGDGGDGGDNGDQHRGNGGTDVTQQQERELVSASNDDAVDALALANEAHTLELATIRQELADERFERDSVELARQGIPPALIELARPILTSPVGAVLDLSNGVTNTKVDVADLVRKLLKESAGFIELAKEKGHSLDLSGPDEKSDERKAILDAWKIDG